MAFLLGLFLGVVVGVGLVMAFVRSENYRSKRRSELVHSFLALLYRCFMFSFSFSFNFD